MGKFLRPLRSVAVLMHMLLTAKPAYCVCVICYFCIPARNIQNSEFARNACANCGVFSGRVTQLQYS
jgi:hypothetical protein